MSEHESDDASDQESGSGPTGADVQRFAVPALFHGACLLEQGPPGAPLILGCHGYGEGAASILDALRRLPSAERFHIAAVEAPHPFYTKSGRVVRSWMTREDREQAIEDNIRYVATVIAELRRRAPTGALFIAGFSQGVAMAWRAAVRCGFPVAGLIALAGDVPPDVANLAPPSLPPVLLGRGTGDAWYDERKMQADLETLDRLGADVKTCVFEGGHEWSGAFYAATETFLDTLAPRRG